MDDRYAISPAPAADEPISLAARGSLACIRLYQHLLSPIIGRGCRFSPTCSRYTHEAIRRHGFFRGWGLGLWRILRCNPFTPGGNDAVP